MCDSLMMQKFTIKLACALPRTREKEASVNEAFREIGNSHTKQGVKKIADISSALIL